METQVGFWEASNVLFLDVGTGYRTVFALQKFIKIYTYDQYIFVHQWYTSIEISKNKQRYSAKSE